MHQLKLVLPLAGLLIAGQALAHKAPHVTTGAPAPARLALVQAGASPAALIDCTRPVPWSWLNSACNPFITSGWSSV